MQINDKLRMLNRRNQALEKRLKECELLLKQHNDEKEEAIVEKEIAQADFHENQK